MEKICSSIILDADFKVEGPMLIYTDLSSDSTNPDTLALEERAFDENKLFDFEHISHVYITSDDKVDDGDFYYWPEKDIINCSSNPDLISNDDKKVIASSDPELIDSGVPSIGVEDMRLIASFYCDNKKMPEIKIKYTTIKIGQCSCPCHIPGNNIMHFMACCNPSIVEAPEIREDGSVDIIGIYEDEPKVEVNLWKGSTLLDKIMIPEFVNMPGILIIDGEYYSFADHLNLKHTAKGGINYVKSTAYKV